MIESFLNKDDFLRTIRETCEIAHFVPPLIQWIHPPIFKIGIIFAHPFEQMKDVVLVRYDYQCASVDEIESLVKQIKESVKLK